eukprot:Nitzschia sp. Nitz4//scaffold23_size168460//103106//104477//NITZ4_002228-RA/size168460-snap-gene-0.108-mRNA-1//1//CDS//3329543662//7929//frame0
MSEKVKGQVKWFNNRKGFGFVSPATGGDDLFLHHSKIVSEAEYKTLKDGLEVEFEIGTDENGKRFADKVTLADGSAVPAAPPRPSPKAKKQKPEEGAKDAAEEAAEPAAKTNNKKKGKGKKQGDAKPANDQAAPEAEEAKKKGRARNQKKNNNRPPKWHEELDASVLKSMEDRSIRIDAGRVFVSLGDARLKVGTGGFITVAHSSAVVAEGSYTCDKEGAIAITWTHVLKLDGDAWKLSTPEAEAAVLPTSLSLKDDAVTATPDSETPETLWGAGKPDPKDAFEPNGFQMRKVAFTAAANPARRPWGQRNRKGGKKEGGAAAAPAQA